MSKNGGFNFGAFRDVQVGNKRENLFFQEADEGTHRCLIVATKAEGKTKHGKSILAIELYPFESDSALGKKRQLFANAAQPIPMAQLTRNVLTFCRVDQTSISSRIESLRALGCSAGDSKIAKMQHEMSVEEILAEGDKAAEAYAGALIEDLLSRFFDEDNAVGMVADIKVINKHKDGKVYSNSFVETIDDDLEAIVNALRDPSTLDTTVEDEAERAAYKAEVAKALAVIAKSGVPQNRLRVGL